MLWFTGGTTSEKTAVNITESREEQKTTEVLFVFIFIFTDF